MNKKFAVHPLTALRFVKTSAWILLLPVLNETVSRLRQRAPTGFLNRELLWLAVLILAAFLRQKAITVSLSENIFTVKTGILAVKNNRVPVSRISVFSAVQTPFDAVFGTVLVEVFDEAKRRGKPLCSVRFRRQTAAELETALFGKPPSENRMSMQKYRLVGGALASASVFGGVLLSIPLVRNLRKLEEAVQLSVSDRVISEIERVVLHPRQILPPVLNLLLLLFAGVYLISFARSLLREYGLTVSFGSHRITVKKGLFVRRQTVIRFSAVNTVFAEQPPILRLFRRWSVLISAAGLHGRRTDETVLVPFVLKKERDAVLSELSSVFGSRKSFCIAGTRRFTRINGCFFANKIAFIKTKATVLRLYTFTGRGAAIVCRTKRQRGKMKQ